MKDSIHYFICELFHSPARVALRDSAATPIRACTLRLAPGRCCIAGTWEDEVAIATPPKEEVLRSDMVRFHRYMPTVENPMGPSVLIVYALNFLHMERWISERPDHPGGVLRQWFKDLYQVTISSGANSSSTDGASTSGK
jgi:hypothetical protein